jgi:hypothetical protein
MTKLVSIIGAGFSRPAKYPTGYDLNQRFFENMENRMLNMSSGEWVWDDYDDASSNNGRLNSDFLNISYLLSEFVERYQKETYMVFNYEEFYDWFRNNYGNIELLQELTTTVNNRLKSEFNIDDTSDHIIENPDINHFRKIYESFNYLIGDLLIRPYERDENIETYFNFIDYVESFDEVELYSLNHDLLIEYIFNTFSVKYSDGFSLTNSPIQGEAGEPLKVFNNSYSDKIRLYKLHGSVDYYRFEEMIEKGAVSNPTGKYWFYKPEDYYNKHYAKRIDLNTNEVVQRYNFNTLPQFLTGKDKMDFIENQHFYGDLYDSFKSSFDNCTELLTVGYSFADLHINSVIKDSVDKFDFKIKNVNPGMDFPFRKGYSTKGIENLESIEELPL